MKPFDPQLYERDDIAKFFVIDWLRAINIEAKVNPDPYGIDLLATSSNGDYQIEVEVKQNWSGWRFPFQTLHYSARKAKFLKDGIQTRFITLNKEWTYAAVVNGESFRSAQKIKKDTIYTNNELFIEIPLNEIDFYKTNDEDW